MARQYTILISIQLSNDHTSAILIVHVRDCGPIDEIILYGGSLVYNPIKVSFYASDFQNIKIIDYLNNYLSISFTIISKNFHPLL